MSQSPLRLAFSAARPIRTLNHPTAFLRSCRACRARLSTTTSPSQWRTLQQRLSPSPSRLTPSSLATTSPQRQFSLSPPHCATVVLQNPRTDEEGNSMSIIISDRAARRLRQITSSPATKSTLTSKPSPSPSDSHLRVTVTSGGCHGFQYLMALEDSSKIDGQEDTIFEYDAQATGEGTAGKAEVVMDSASLELLKGSTIDFTQELIGSQFKVVGNPRATSSCGCGTSFDIE